MLAEFSDRPLADTYWEGHDLAVVIADPFMGGGTSVFEALRLGAGVVGCDINPMAYWLVRQAVEPIDVEQFRTAGEVIWNRLLDRIGDLYKTACTECGHAASVKYFLWVKTCACPTCGEDVRLFPGYLVAEPVRHPHPVYHCPWCDELRELPDWKRKVCPVCVRSLEVGNVKRGVASCLRCDTQFKFSEHLDTPPRHQLFGIEYQCSLCYPAIKGRQFKSPSESDHANVQNAASRLRDSDSALAIPTDEVPKGDETNRLLRWGYHHYRDLFGDRQLLGLGILLEEIQRVTDVRIRHALATVFSDFLRYQNLLCRYDTYALKCQDIFSVHGFPVGLVACENNLPGIRCVGSGSFIHFVEKYARAKLYAQRPYETQIGGVRKTLIYTEGESIEATLMDIEPDASGRAAWLNCAPSQNVPLMPDSLDGVFTDPPYFANVQYAELMDFCYVWLRKLVNGDAIAFASRSTRTQDELTGNETLGRGLGEFAAGLSEIFCRMASALKPGAPLCFTYHHNSPAAYAPLVVAILDAGLTTTGVLPAPAEMTASLHIAGTKSSIVDSVFVCRDAKWVRSRREGWADERTRDERVSADALGIADGGYRCTPGDLACLTAGHIAADAVRALERSWNLDLPAEVRLKVVTEFMEQMSDGTVGDQ